MDNLKTVYFVSLGCPKNRVDTDVMAAALVERGLELVFSPDEADVIVVNTCSFIGDAKEESVDELLEMAQYRSRGRCQMLVAAGCLPQRNGDDLKEAMPEIDVMLGTGSPDRIADLLEGQKVELHPGTGAHFLQNEGTARLVTPGQTSVYIKIADGCSRKCAFCAIPGIRGKAGSRSIENVVAEAKMLAEYGAKELVLVAQDTAAYGRDLKDGTSLQKLLVELNKIDGVHWIRVMYLYPDSVDAALLETMRDLKKVVPYLDIPIQHASESMLRAMRRGHGQRELKTCLLETRRIWPEAFLRTTVLVGFPEETDADIDELLAFMEEYRFNHLGAFRYSDEEGTPAFGRQPQVSKKESYNRFRKVMARQRKIVNKNHRALVGQTLDVLVEDVEDEGGFVLLGRHAGQAPEIDGITYIVNCDAQPGDIIPCRITEFKEHDLVAEPVQEDDV
ncbi:MAG: 30S ribosomal protein S12 methylthiotransferase RimO [Deltaproteobacteria bacterium]|nr:30S ribosomal protein S12 methylthiotransferase RimO [Deltaproteobacteria bacterium]